jgi:II/X family phage/plasmid replication protein
MIDWTSFVIPCFHRNPIKDGQIAKVDRDGELLWKVDQYMRVEGSHEAVLLIRTEDWDPARGGLSLKIKGNPAKWFQGHNLWGTDDLQGLILETMRALVDRLDLEPTAEDQAAWHRGHYRLTKVDVNYSWQLKTCADCLAWIYAAERTAHLRHRGPGKLKGSTLYFGMDSRRWAFKIYSKGNEIINGGKAHRILIRDEDQLQSLHAWADDKLRFEVVLHSMELRKLGLDRGAAWTETTAIELHREKLQGLEMSDTVNLSHESLAGLSPRLVLAYQAWKEGHDMRKLLPDRTFYRYRKELLRCGIDIAIRQPHEDRSNVVPLVRVLEAVPAQIPAWAYGTPLYFEPRKMIG